MWIWQSEELTELSLKRFKLILSAILEENGTAVFLLKIRLLLLQDTNFAVECIGLLLLLLEFL